MAKGMLWSDVAKKVAPSGALSSPGVDDLIKMGFPEGTARKIAPKPNPLGQYALPVASITAAGGLLAPEDAEAGVITRNGKRLLEAWHGSPHSFDRFSLDQIGTGEGAQAYGHGLYFADREDVARQYQQRAGINPVFGNYQIPGAVADDIRKQMLAEDDWLTQTALEGLLDGHRPPHKLRQHILDIAEHDGLDSTKALSVLDDAVARAENFDGSLYRVELDVDPDTLLDWDKPLSEQTEVVQQALGPIVDEQRKLMSERAHIYTRPVDEIIASRTAGEWLDYVPESGVVGEKARPETVSAYLNEQGIPGIRYLDGDSRSTGEGTYNYVMFDDKPISIVGRGDSADPTSGNASLAPDNVGKPNPLGQYALPVAGASITAGALAPDEAMASMQGEGLKGGLDYATGLLSDITQFGFAGGKALGDALMGRSAGRSFLESLSEPWWDVSTDGGMALEDAVGGATDALMNYGGALGYSANDMIGDAASFYTQTARPWLADNLGEYGTNLLEGGVLMGAGVMGAKGNNKVTRKAGDVFETPVMDTINVKGYSDNPLMALVDPERPPATISSGTVKRRLREYEENPSVREREDLRLLGGRMEATEDLGATHATYEDFLGKPLIPLPADRTSVGNITRIAGVDLDSPVVSLGGPKHADKFGNWRSMYGAARAKQSQANRVGDITGQMPAYMYMSMGNPGSNFSHMASEGALKYILGRGGLSGEAIDALNNKMLSLPDKGDTAGIAKAWPGYENEEQLIRWLIDDDPGTGPSLGNRRKAFMDSLSLKEIQNGGGPIPSDVYSAINEPVLLGEPVGASGFRAMQSVRDDPRGLLVEPGVHKSYDTVIRGDGVFALDEPMVPWDVMFPDMAAARAGKKPSEAYRSTQVAGANAPSNYQMADEKWLEGIRNYLKAHPKEAGNIDPAILKWLGLAGGGSYIGSGMLADDVEESGVAERFKPRQVP